MDCTCVCSLWLHFFCRFRTVYLWLHTSSGRYWWMDMAAIFSSSILCMVVWDVWHPACTQPHVVRPNSGQAGEPLYIFLQPSNSDQHVYILSNAWGHRNNCPAGMRPWPCSVHSFMPHSMPLQSTLSSVKRSGSGYLVCQYWRFFSFFIYVQSINRMSY